MSTGGTYEFVVAGELGPLLLSMLPDMHIVARPAETRVHVATTGDAALFPLLAAMSSDERPLARLVIYRKRSDG